MSGYIAARPPHIAAKKLIASWALDEKKKEGNILWNNLTCISLYSSFLEVLFLWRIWNVRFVCVSLSLSCRPRPSPTTKNSPHQSSLLRNQMIYSCLPYSFPYSGSVVVVILFNQRNGYTKNREGTCRAICFFFFFWWHFMIFLINRKEKPRGSAHHRGEKCFFKKKGGKSETHCKLFNIRVR